MGRSRDDTLISMKEVPKFLLTGKVLMGNPRKPKQARLVKYKRRGFKVAKDVPMRGTYFLTGPRVRGKN